MSKSITLGNLGGTIMSSNGEVILKFKFKNDCLTSVGSLNESVKPLPYEFIEYVGTDKIISGRDIRLFFENRITPSTRINIDNDLQKYNISFYDPEVIIRYSKGRCIHDDFWLDCDNDIALVLS